MKNESANLPAFPTQDFQGDVRPGMTLRDYFAAQWMNGYISNPDTPDMTRQEAAEYAYRMANAMLAERERDND